MLGIVLTTGLLLPAIAVLVGSSYLASLTLAALAYRPNTAVEAGGGLRLAVLVPAHNEAALIARCVSSLMDQSYQAEQVVVIADNCDDATALEAAAAGARVMVRQDSTHLGKGHALRWAMDALLAAPNPPDGIAVVDADSIADHGLLQGLARALAGGAGAAQADYTALVEEAAGGGDRLRALAVLLFNRTRNRGRSVLHLPASLLGNGMLLSRQLLEAHPWDAFSAVEDLEFATQCRIQGVHPRFVPEHGVRGPLPAGYQAGTPQRLRWEGGRFHVLRRLGPGLLHRLARRPDLATLDALLDLAVPPLWILFLIALAGLVISIAASVLDSSAAPAAVVWAACCGLVAFHAMAGLRAGEAPRGSYRALLALPGFVAWKLRVYVRFLRGFDPNRWQRSIRRGEIEWR